MSIFFPTAGWPCTLLVWQDLDWAAETPGGHWLGGAHWSPAATLQHDTVRMLHLTAQHSRISPYPGSPGMAIFLAPGRRLPQGVHWLPWAHTDGRTCHPGGPGDSAGWVGTAFANERSVGALSSNKTKGRMFQQIDRGFQTKEKGHAVGSRCLSPQKKAKTTAKQNHNLDGGFKCFYLHPYLGGDVQLDEHHLFQMGGVVQKDHQPVSFFSPQKRSAHRKPARLCWCHGQSHILGKRIVTSKRWGGLGGMHRSPKEWSWEIWNHQAGVFQGVVSRFCWNFILMLLDSIAWNDT